VSKIPEVGGLLSLICRREFVAALAGASVFPLVARGQQAAKTYRVVILDSARKIADISESGVPVWAIFLREMRALGYIEGQNLIVERRSAEQRLERYADLAREAVALKPDVIVTNATDIALQLKPLTQTIPIFTWTYDPVVAGLTASMARPGGNITGVSIDAGLESFAKAFEILRSINPSMTKAAVFGAYRPDLARDGGAFVHVMTDAARQLNIELVWIPIDRYDEAEYRRIIGAFVENGVGGVVVSAAGILAGRNPRSIVDLLNGSRLIAVYPYADYARQGGLIAYAPDLVELDHLQVRYVDRILKGSNPAEMPFLQPTKFLTVVNLKTARALGLQLPATLLATADEVIE
jgi:putative ABC transport system substrate-binding protein